MIGAVIGTLAGSYRIVDTISVGGMGTVYRAEHTLLGGGKLGEVHRCEDNPAGPPAAIAPAV